MPRPFRRFPSPARKRLRPPHFRAPFYFATRTVAPHATASPSRHFHEARPDPTAYRRFPLGIYRRPRPPHHPQRRAPRLVADGAHRRLSLGVDALPAARPAL